MGVVDQEAGTGVVYKSSVRKEQVFHNTSENGMEKTTTKVWLASATINVVVVPMRENVLCWYRLHTRIIHT